MLVARVEVVKDALRVALDLFLEASGDGVAECAQFGI